MIEKNKSRFIVLEGTDGSGKTEQFNRLLLEFPESLSFKTLDFPQYDEPSSYFIRECLNGHYGTTIEEIGPKTASLFYALDRYDAYMKKIKKWIKDDMVIISNRYIGSNMGHQGAKIDSRRERVEFYKWLYELEYGILGIPKPDLNIILHVPAEVAQLMVNKKPQRAYLENGRRDIAENDLVYLKKAEQAYLELAELFPDDFTVIECAPGGELLSIGDVHEKVWAIAQKVLGI